MCLHNSYNLYRTVCCDHYTGSATLRVLDVSQNSIGDDGMAVTSGVLQHSKSLTKLGVVDCALSVKGIL